MAALIDDAGRMLDSGEPALALKLLRAAAMSGMWADRSALFHERLLRTAGRVGAGEADPAVLSILTFAAPVETGAEVIRRAGEWTPDPREPLDMLLIGTAASAVGAHDLSFGFLNASVEATREQGRLAQLAQALMLRAWTEIHLGRWSAAASDAEEARRLADETAQPIWLAGALSAQAMLFGLRGDAERSDAHSAEAERLALALGVKVVLSVNQLARGVAAIGAGKAETAFEHLARLYDPADPAYHHLQSGWALGSLAEAAVRSGRAGEARAVLAAWEPTAARTPSPWLHLSMRHARALLAEGDEAESLFEVALAADLSRWPFERARVQLAFGEWLRRRRRVAESRAPLRAAHDVFDALRAEPWAERGRQELRAAGESIHARGSSEVDELTPQELRIAQMAAQGLSNREIGQRLYLSHRTVSSHLYRIFPKLGIGSRFELRSALAETNAR